MAHEYAQTSISRVAAADLSALQFTFVKIDSNGKVAANTTAGAYVVGVLQNKPEAGQIATVAVEGVTKVQFGATITPDDQLMSTTAGKADVAVAAASPGNFVRGQALSGGASGEIGTMLLGPTGYLNT